MGPALLHLYVILQRFGTSVPEFSPKMCLLATIEQGVWGSWDHCQYFCSKATCNSCSAQTAWRTGHSGFGLNAALLFANFLFSLIGKAWLLSFAYFCKKGCLFLHFCTFEVLPMYFCLLLSEAKWLSPSFTSTSIVLDIVTGWGGGGSSCAGENFLWTMLV